MAAPGDFVESPHRAPFVSKCSNLRLTLESLAPNKFGPPRVKVSIANDGPLPVSLMVPGDGSEDDGRNPTITWTVDGKVPPRGLRCGNISSLAPRDVVEIASHDSMELDRVHLPEDQAIGVHNVVIRYRNDPAGPMPGFKDGQPGVPAALLAKARATTPCELVSAPLRATWAPERP